ncbi:MULTISPECIES: DNA helicase [unclassified Microbacterium]|uniref:DNA helicase n=1 Tax=unclassified Microbacterium TaxID=2609290 RepID=UPI00214CF295|nr:MULTISPECIES: DNA helicase [unclassified Microbacterium]MCR2783050.1 DNA helicase [Microbacterium sp. zg.B96]MDL5352178.1 DNA helicase [Microbacterium sp. zg-YB36]WIM16064.1 DNA helicase [Microbacterium sp. zg-B96]
MSLSRKRKKELRKLQQQANTLWESQQVLVGEAAHVAKEASRQLGKYNREQVLPAINTAYGHYAAPYVTKAATVSRSVLNDKVVPAAGAVVGSAMSVWDAANDTRSRVAAGRGFAAPDVAKYSKKADKYSKDAAKKIAKKLSVVAPEPKKSVSAGGVIAIILGAAAALGIVYAAWQTLRADDELWVADDPLSAPDA